MEIVLKQEDFINSLKIVEKTTLQRAIQPVLSNILIKTLSNDRIVFGATDLNQTIIYKSEAEVVSEGEITINPRILSEIINKLPNKLITLKTNDEKNTISIICEKSKFEVSSIRANEFPNILEDKKSEEEKEYSIDKEVFNKAIKQTIFCCAQSETATILNGVCITIKDNIFEAAATDGNRLARVRKAINSRGEENSFIVSYKVLNEILRISSIVKDKNITIKVINKKIQFIFDNLKYSAELIEGTYPKYQQLIPTTNEKIVSVKRNKLIESVERVSIIVDERTNSVKFMFEKDNLTLKSDISETGSGSDEISIKYDYEDLVIGFNYKYVLDCLKSMDCEDIRIEMATNLSATIFRPDIEEDSYICLIMPVQVR